MLTTKHYVIMVFEDLHPVLYGDYATSEMRDLKAKRLKKLHGNEHGIYFLNVDTKGLASVGSYCGGFEEEKED